MVIVADIDGFIVKRILVDNGSLCNMLISKVAIKLEVDLAKLKKVCNSFGGNRRKPVKVEDSTELTITVEEKDKSKTDSPL